MRIGIIGLPSSGKTTVFNALTHGHVETAAFSTGRMEVHTAVVAVPDERVDRLAAMYRPRKTTYAQVQYKDIAGLTKGIGQSGGLAGPLLNEIAQNDALLHVVRGFHNPQVPHPEGSVDPVRDVVLLENELILNDMVILGNRLERLSQRLGKGGNPRELEAARAEHALVQRLLAHLEAEKPLRDLELTPEEEKALRGFNLLSQKPMLIVLNVDDDADESSADVLAAFAGPRRRVMALRGRLEAELAQMEPDEAAAFLADFGIAEPGLHRVIRESYRLLRVQSFFTVGEDEVRAWTVPIGATALDAAATIHTDLAKGFIRAEVVHYDDLIAAGSMAEARKHATWRLEGKDYIVRDGDIIHIRFAV